MRGRVGGAPLPSIRELGAPHVRPFIRPSVRTGAPSPRRGEGWILLPCLPPKRGRCVPVASIAPHGGWAFLLVYNKTAEGGSPAGPPLSVCRVVTLRLFATRF